MICFWSYTLFSNEGTYWEWRWEGFWWFKEDYSHDFEEEDSDDSDQEEDDGLRDVRWRILLAKDDNMNALFDHNYK